MAGGILNLYCLDSCANKSPWTASRAPPLVSATPRFQAEGLIPIFPVRTEINSFFTRNGHSEPTLAGILQADGLKEYIPAE